MKRATVFVLLVGGGALVALRPARAKEELRAYSAGRPPTSTSETDPTATNAEPSSGETDCANPDR